MGIFSVLADAATSLKNVGRGTLDALETGFSKVVKSADDVKLKLGGRTVLNAVEVGEVSKIVDDLDVVAKNTSGMFDGRVSRMIKESDAYKFANDLKVKNTPVGGGASAGVGAGAGARVPESLTDSLAGVGAKVKGGNVVFPNGTKIKVADASKMSKVELARVADLPPGASWHQRLRSITEGIEMPLAIVGLAVPLLLMNLLTRSAAEAENCDASSTTGSCAFDYFLENLFPGMSLGQRVAVAGGASLSCSCCCCCACICLVVAVVGFAN